MYGAGGASALPKREGCLFSQLEVFEANSASNGAACIVSFVGNYSEKYLSMPRVEKYFWQVVKKGTFEVVTMFTGSTIFALSNTAGGCH